MAWTANRLPLVNKLFGDDFLVQLGSDSLRVKNLNSGRSTETERPAPRAFDHPRCVIGSFEAAEEAILRAFSQVRQSALGGFVEVGTRSVLVQIKRDLEGGLTDIEARGLFDLHYMCTKADTVRLYEGQHHLSDQKVRELLSASPEDEPAIW